MAHPTRRDVLHSAAASAALCGADHTAAAHAASLPQAKPEDIGLDSGQLNIAYELLRKWTTGPEHPIPGAAVLVGRNGKAVAPRFFGTHSREKGAPPVRSDSLFLMASITKPMVYAAGLRQVERGRLNLTDPVARYLPEFRGGGKDEVLVRHLFTHTSGLPDMPPGNLELRKSHSPVSKFVEAAVRDSELLFRPGTRVSYQSCGTLLVAEIVRRLADKPIAEVLKTEIFDPLGMKSTFLGAGGLPRERLVSAEDLPSAAGTDFSWNSDYWRDLGAPWGGMFSTAADFAVVCWTMLAGGSWNGARILSAASVRAMTTNRLLEEPNLPEAVARAQPWGLGWRLNHPGRPDSWGDLLGGDVFGHTGSTGTMVWMDPRSKTFCILLTNALRARAPWRLVHLSNAVAAAIL